MLNGHAEMTCGDMESMVQASWRAALQRSVGLMSARESKAEPARESKAEPSRESKAEPANESWREVDRKLRRIARRRGALDREELALIRRAIVLSIWRHCGMTSIREYLEHVMGYGPTVASERVRVAEALDAMPMLERALETNELPFSAIREITRIATRKTEAAWVAACVGKNLRQIEDLLAEREPGDRPESPRKPDLRAKNMRFKGVRPATEAAVLRARQQLEAERGERLDDDPAARRSRRASRRRCGGAVSRADAGRSDGVSELPDCAPACGRQGHRAQAGGARPPAVRRGMGRCNGHAAREPGRHAGGPQALRLRDHDRSGAGMSCGESYRGASHRAARAGWLARHRELATAVRRPSCGAAPRRPSDRGSRELGGDHDARGSARGGRSGDACPRGRSGGRFCRGRSGSTFHVENPSDADLRAEAADLRAEAADLRAEAVLALRTLGFSKFESVSAVESAVAELEGAFTLEQLLRAALRCCAKSTQ